MKRPPPTNTPFYNKQRKTNYEEDEKDEEQKDF